MKIFWSWQSDTPGKTGRHFIRDAILAAIQDLKQSEDIEEPPEQARRGALHLDQDRQGVPGSPDLAATILKKIRETTVFIADVTPIAEGPERKEDGKVYKKKIMNPNVAIELGYALHHPGDSAILMVMNRHYGQRDDLPFDLKHKAGPICFCLPPDADKTQIKAELALLKVSLVEALKYYLKSELTTSTAPRKETFEERANKQKREILLEQERQKFLTSTAGVQSAANEVRQLVKIVLEKIKALPFEMQTKEVGSSLLLLCEGVGMSILWKNRFSNTLEDAALELTLWDGSPPYPGNFEEPVKLGGKQYIFDRNWENNIGWRYGVGNPPLTITEQLAEECLQFLLDRVHEKSVKNRG